MKRVLGGRFALSREIGAGGMARVYLGNDEVLDRPVAVKVLRGGFGSSEQVDSRFRREGRTAAKLSHPNIVQVYDAGEDDLDGNEVSYIVMEYVPGGDLMMLLQRRGPLKERDLARIGADVASGLSHAHTKNIVHRDIKPQNILMDEYGRPKLTDFGIARALDATYATRTGSYLGTASYSSPEQLRGEEITPKSDVYSLGCTLYEAAVGEPPFCGGPIEVAGQQLTKLPAAPRVRGASLSVPFESLVLSCLAKDPADRPDTIGLQERLLVLSAQASGGIPAPPAGETTTQSFAPATGAAGITVARGLGAAARRIKGRAGEKTLVAPAGLFGRRRRQKASLAALVALAALSLLTLLAFAAGPALLDRSSTEEQAQQEEAAGGAAEQAEPEGAVPVADEPEATTAAETTTEATTEGTVASASEPAPPASEAERAVFDMYVQESYQTPSTSWAFLSERLQDEVGTPERWAQREQIYSLWYVDFPRMPEAEVSGDEAEVSFQVREYRTGGNRLKSGTWVCVNEGGEWKLDRLEDERIQRA